MKDKELRTRVDEIERMVWGLKSMSILRVRDEERNLFGHYSYREFTVKEVVSQILDHLGLEADVIPAKDARVELKKKQARRKK